MDALDRMFQRLVYIIRSNYPEYLSRPFEVAEVYQTLIPYRHNRRELGLETNQEYELVLMDLLSGARGYVRGDARMQESLRQELASSNPDATRFRVFSGAEVSISPTALEDGAARGGPSGSARGEHPVREERKPARELLERESPAVAAEREFAPPDAEIEMEPAAAVAPRKERPRAEPPRAERHVAESPRAERQRAEPPRAERQRAESARSEESFSEPSRENAPRQDRPRQAARVAQDAPATDPLAVSRARASRLAAARAAVAPGGSVGGGNSASSARTAPAQTASENEMANQPRAMSASALGGSCRYCSGTLPDGRKIVFCPHCGQNLTVQHCPACGTELELGWKFCTTCGRSVASS